MHRNVTAIYRTFATADLVRRELLDLGISSGDVHVIPERDEPVGSSGHREDSRSIDRLHDLHLPDNDLKTYQHSVRRGDYVVSAEVDESQVERVKQIMRRPEDEAHQFALREGEFRDEQIIGYSEPDRWRRDPDLVAAHEPGMDEEWVRSYRRPRPLNKNS